MASAGKTTRAMVRAAKSGKGTLTFNPKKVPPKKPGLSGDKAETRKGPQFKR